MTQFINIIYFYLQATQKVRQLQKRCAYELKSTQGRCSQPSRDIPSPVIGKWLYSQNKSVNEFAALQPDSTSPDWPDRRTVVSHATESMPETSLPARQHAKVKTEQKRAQEAEVVLLTLQWFWRKARFVLQKWEEVDSRKSSPSTLSSLHTFT